MPGITSDEIVIPSADGSQSYVFSPSGRQLKTLDALTGATIYSLSYDSAGRLSSVTDADGNVTTIERDLSGNPTAIVSPYGQRMTLAIGPDGYLASVTNPAGGSTKMDYYSGGLLKDFTDGRGNTSSMIYDAEGRLIHDQDAQNGHTDLARTESGGGSYKVTTTNAEGGTRQYLVELLPDGTKRRTFIDGRGFKTVTLIGTDGSETTTAPHGSITKTVLGPDPRYGMLAPVVTSQVVTMPSGLKSTTTDTRTATFQTSNDKTSPLVTLTDTVVDNGNSSTTVYNAAARTITSTSAEGRTTVSTLDAKGRVVLVQVPGVLDTSFSYDGHGQLKQVVQGGRTVTYDYDANRNLASITDPLSHATSFTYDLADRLKTETEPDGSMINFSYDASGNMTGLTPPGESESTFSYDADNRLKSVTAPDVGTGNDTTTYMYNKANQVIAESFPDGSEIAYTYCECGRLQTITAPWGTYTYTYSATTGSLSELDSPGGFSLNLGYDGALLTSTTETGPVAGSVSWTYNPNLQVASESVDGGNTVTYGYDKDGLLTQAGDLTLTRDPGNGSINGSTLGSITDSVGYNQYGELGSYQADVNGSSAIQDTYTRDNLGRIAQKVETIDGVTTTTVYGYDLQGRLRTVTENGVLIQTYGYDANGNRTSLTTPSGTVTGTYNAQDELKTYGTNTYWYTPNGYLQQVTDSATGQTTKYTYDDFGNLTHVDLPDGHTIDYLIDGENRRVGKKVDGVLTEGFLYSGQLQPVAMLDGAGNIVERFVYGTGVNVPKYMVKDGVTYRFVTDQVGSVRLVVNAATGVGVQRLDYDAFGNILRDTNPGFQPFGFAGGLYDADTGLVRFGARDYDASLGRWLSIDPTSFDGGDSNLYTYGLSNPLFYVDPLGTDVTVIVNNNDVIVGTHVGLYVNDANGKVLYDPGGSYRTGTRGTGDAFYDDEVDIADYLKYQRTDGPTVDEFDFVTTPVEDQTIIERIQNQHGCPPLFCATCAGEILRGIGPFKGLGSTRTPAGMDSALAELEKKLHK
jgi:RHS repeat-associated protein